MINIKDLNEKVKRQDDDFVSLGWLSNALIRQVDECRRNNINPYDVPVTVYNQSDRSQYLLDGIAFGFGAIKPARLGLCFYNAQEIDFFEGEDKQPESGGEFWSSRGPSSTDCSGFVVSKAAGERLLDMIHKVLGRSETESWLDWRKYEPNWIQFKFSATEFDIVKLDSLSQETKTITMEMLQECAIKHSPWQRIKNKFYHTN